SRGWLHDALGFGRDDFVLLTVGRLDRQKNPLLLLEAFARLASSMPDAKLAFVGDGVLRGELADRIGQLRLAGRVQVCGVKPASEVARYLHAADLFVLSSAYEGMPMCVLEALGSGLPVVSTNVGEVARVVRPGVNGELVQEHDAQALAHAIAECRSRLEHYRGDPCREAVQQYTPQRVLMPLFDNYRRLSRWRRVN